MPTVPLIAADSIAFECPELGGGGRSPQRATPHTFDGTGSATTVVSAMLGGANARDYVGCLVEPAQGDYEGIPRQITSFNPATNTATFVEGWPADPTGGGTIGWRMWRPTEAMCRAEGAGGATTFVADADADASGTPGRDEVANYWGTPDRYALWVRGGAAVDRVALVTADAAAAAGVKSFTVEAGAFGVAPAEGDFAVLRKILRFVGGDIVTPDLPQLVIDRVHAKGAAANDEADAPAVTRIRRDCSIEGATLEVQPVASAASGATLAVQPEEAGDLLDAILAMDADGSSVVATLAGDAVTLNITTGTHERFGVGNLVMANGEVRQIRTITDGGVGDDILTVSPAFSAAVPVGTTIYGGVNYWPINTGFRSHTYEFFLGGRRIQVLGWLPSVQIQGLVAESQAKWVFSGPADSHWEDGWKVPALTTSKGGNRFPSQPVRVPILGGRSTVLLNGADISDVVIEATIDYGYKFRARPVVGTFGGNDGVHRNGRRETVGTLKVHMDDFAWIRRFQTGSLHSLIVQLGASAAGTLAIVMPSVQFKGQPYADDGGAYVQDLPFVVLGTGVEGTDATGAEVRIPDIVTALI